MTKAKVPPDIQALIRRDIDDAAERKDAASLRNFAREADTSGMPDQASRAYEVASLIESWEAKSARAELLKIKAAFEPQPPTQADLIRQFDAMVWDRAAPFSVNDFEEDERKRVEAQNAALRERDRQFEEQRARQVVHDEPTETSWWRR